MREDKADTVRMELEKQEQARKPRGKFYCKKN
jgi:hypothetical protein